MSMFRFWSADSRGSEKTVETPYPTPISDEPPATATPVHVTCDRPLKRRRPSLVDTGAQQSAAEKIPLAKRVKTEQYGGLPSPTSASADGRAETVSQTPTEIPDFERAREVIQSEFGLEILMKHNELRLINQELAKCQIALEQLRRCHLMPYPVNCPTPEQMLNISAGKGPALQSCAGTAVPKWAPPFGVVDGPYARHYAKWLIPDPMFDGIQPETPGAADAGRARSAAAEGRSTRNSIAETGGGRRAARGSKGQGFQALPSGYTQPKDKHSPCILKRSDGQVVKLVCIDCHRWDFSSTQGFINHCRIAHRRDFKSHEEAAVASGHPVELDDAGGVLGQEKNPTASPSGFVHPLARSQPLEDQETYNRLRARVREAMEIWRANEARRIQSSAPPSSSAHSSSQGPQAPSDLFGATSTPHLSRLLLKKQFKGDLSAHIADATVKVNLDELSSPEDAEDEDFLDGSLSPKKPCPMGAARTPAVMRVPARTPAIASSPSTSDTRTSRYGSDASVTQLNTPIAAVEDSEPVLQRDEAEAATYDDDMLDVDLSPNTMTSNNAPSLVSDDGEYDDDSDDGSSSDEGPGNDGVMDAESVSDVAEISIDDQDRVKVTPRPLHHRRGSGATAMKLTKDEGKHVTFVASIPSQGGKAGRKRKVSVKR